MERLAQAVVIGGTTLVMVAINTMVMGTLMAFNFKVAKTLNPPRDVNCADCPCHRKGTCGCPIR